MKNVRILRASCGVIWSRSGRNRFNPLRRAISAFEKRSACSCRIRSRTSVAGISAPGIDRPRRAVSR